MWNVKAKAIPVIRWATGTISESLRQYLSNIPEKHEIKEQKNSHIGHCTHTAESTNVNVQNISRAKKHFMEHRLSIQNSCNTVYPGNMVFFSYMTVHTPHKGDNKDNNNNNKLRN